MTGAAPDLAPDEDADRAERFAARLDEAAERAVAQAPPFTPAQLAQLATILDRSPR